MPTSTAPDAPGLAPAHRRRRAPRRTRRRRQGCRAAGACEVGWPRGGGVSAALSGGLDVLLALQRRRPRAGTQDHDGRGQRAARQAGIGIADDHVQESLDQQRACCRVRYERGQDVLVALQ